MNKKLITLLLAAGIAVIFVATGLHAGTKVADTITMETKGYKKRKKGAPKFKLVEFTHKKHIEEYELSCGECHHDKDGKALELKMGDDVQSCAECHNKFKKPKKKKGKKKSKKKDMMVHEFALHGNCIGCHKDFNKEKTGNAKKGPAPTKCGGCHKKA
ncbi:MAG: cytochrome c family protein [Desulfobacterales bacterium]|nr:cytochrome c family protein [Desulfobacterales bacterium]